MLKNNKGITMITLVITVIILIILASITAYSGVSTIKESRYSEGISEMKAMQTHVNEWYEEYKNGDTSIWDKGTSLSASGREEQAVKAFNSAKENNLSITDMGEITGYKYYSKDVLLDQLDIDGIKYDFIINIETRSVILIDGIQKDGVTYYSLGEIEGELYNVSYEKELICALVDDLGTSSTIYLYGNSDAITEGIITISTQGVELGTIDAVADNKQIDNTNNYLTYNVTKNGKYLFKATDEQGKTTEISVNVTNIEKFSPIEEVATQTKGENAYSYKGAVVPKGFYVDTLSKLDTGLVITDQIGAEGYSTGNEWVWVPVNSDVGNNDFYIEESGNLAGATSVGYTKYSKLYSFMDKTREAYGTFHPYGITAGTLGKPSATSGYRESAIFSDTTYGESVYYSSINKRGTGSPFTEAEGITAVATQYITDYDNMITSVNKYGGFYIGRYEITANGEKAGDSITDVNWYSLYNSCMEFDKDNVTSGMIYGTLWDATMQWLAKSNYSVGYTGNTTSGYGNYNTEAVKVGNSDTTITVKPGRSSTKLKTGQTSYTKSNNIYDLSGNCYDWTQEANDTSYRVLRRRRLRQYR